MEICLRLWCVDGAGCCHERREFGAFRAKGKRLDTAEPLQQPHAPAREVLGAAAGEEEVQFEDELAAAAHSEVRALPLVKDCRLAALRETAAHDHDDGRFIVEAGADGLADSAELIGVALMEGIVFGDDANDMHKEELLSCDN